MSEPGNKAKISLFKHHKLQHSLHGRDTQLTGKSCRFIQMRVSILGLAHKGAGFINTRIKRKEINDNPWVNMVCGGGSKINIENSALMRNTNIFNLLIQFWE